VATSSKEPKALSRVQFAVIMGVLAACAIAALVSVGAMVAEKRVCPSETQTSRPGNATCWASYVHQDKTGVVGIPVESPSSAPAS
jgi:hypothetical protein